MIELRRRYSGSKGSDSPSFSRLPNGYQEVEYLESDGNQYIDLGFRPSVFLKHETEVKYQYLTAFRTSYILASYWETNRGKITYGVSIRWDSDYIISRIWVEGGQSVFKQIPSDTQVHTSKLGFDGSQYYSGIDGELAYNQISDISVLSGNLLAFKAGLETPAIGRIFGIKYTENGVVAHEFIPCRNPQGIAGMYDVAGVYENLHDGFYPNAGTGEFLYGQDVHYNIPFEYQQVEFLEVANANTAQLPVNQATFIDTGVIADRNTSFYIDYEFKGVYSVTLQNQVGAGAGDNGRFYISIDNNKIGCAIGVGTTTDIPIEINKRFQAELNAYKDTLTVLVDGAEYVRNIDTDSFVSSLLPISLFGRRENSSTISFCFGARVYACVIKNQDDPVRNLIPCYRKEDNVAGMYDLVSGEFYTNAGTGTFDVGAEVIG